MNLHRNLIQDFSSIVFSFCFVFGSDCTQLYSTVLDFRLQCISRISIERDKRPSNEFRLWMHFMNLDYVEDKISSISSCRLSAPSKDSEQRINEERGGEVEERGGGEGGGGGK